MVALKRTPVQQVTIRLEPERKAALEAIAVKRGCSMNAVIKQALDEFVKKNR
jgi:predicted transcriptional regulator